MQMKVSYQWSSLGSSPKPESSYSKPSMSWESSSPLLSSARRWPASGRRLPPKGFPRRQRARAASWLGSTSKGRSKVFSE